LGGQFVILALFWSKQAARQRFFTNFLTPRREDAKFSSQRPDSAKTAASCYTSNDMIEETAEPTFQNKPQKFGDREISWRWLLGCAVFFGLVGMCACVVLLTRPPVPQPSTILVAREIEYGATENGRLSAENNYEQSWRFEAQAGDRVLITMRSEDLDSYLYLYSNEIELLVEDDDSGLGESSYDAQISYTIPNNGTYFIVAREFFDEENTGDYTVTLVKE
jgi:hypothetical protein